MKNPISDCHLAETMPESEATSSFIQLCSFCGKGCIAIQPTGVSHDLELTLRRWKDGDCLTEDMMSRLAIELDRTQLGIANKVRPHLQHGKPPKFTFVIDRMRWEKSPSEKKKEPKETK